jgi:hypothetical protein
VTLRVQLRASVKMSNGIRGTYKLISLEPILKYNR